MLHLEMLTDSSTDQVLS